MCNARRILLRRKARAESSTRSSYIFAKLQGYGTRQRYKCVPTFTIYIRGELSYLAPLGSENISAPYFKRLPVPRQK